MLKSLFKPIEDEEDFDFPTRGTGVIDSPEDYRDIYLGSFQKPLGAPESTNHSFGITLQFLEHLPQLDQKNLSTCVPYAIAKLVTLFHYRRTGKILELSPRFTYQLCKLFDGVPTPGTFPRIGALMFSTFGCCEQNLLEENSSLKENEYKNFLMTDEMIFQAKQNRTAGFSFVDKNIDAIKEAIYQNSAIVGTTEIGDEWRTLPLKSKKSKGPHYTLWYDYETLPDGDVKIYIDNSWGKTWLSWIKDWRNPGKGYFLWSEHKDTVRDIIAFSSIPKTLLEEIKKAPYKFLTHLKVGDSSFAVRELQKLLNENPYTCVAIEGAGSPGNETNYFGMATFKALKRWQIIKMIPGTGFFGPLSIKEANKRIKSMTLIEALIQVESGGEDNAVGDKHLMNKAYGCLQIRQPYIEDVFPGRKAEECLGNRKLSIQIFEAYMNRYEPNGTDEEKARAHNAGPNWRVKKPATDGYWKKVSILLNK